MAAGLAASYVPGVPDYHLDPHIVLPLLLPPLLHTAALDSSYLDLRANLRPVALLSVGYVLFATLAVGWVAYLVVPDLPLTAALVLGAVVARPTPSRRQPSPAAPGCPPGSRPSSRGVPGQRRDGDHRLQGGARGGGGRAPPGATGSGSSPSPRSAGSGSGWS
ncbi:cation:proton antiporter [Streptomyces sp. M19]